MKTLKQLVEEMKAMEDIREVLEAYEEMAAEKMREIREGILKGRDYFSRLAELAEEVGADLGEVRTHQAGEAVVFISANEGLFGEIVEKVFSQFINYVKEFKGDVYIVGKVGRQMWREVGESRLVKMIELPDDQVREEGLSRAMRFLGKYQRVRVFYGQFFNIARQEGAMRIVEAIKVDQEGNQVKERNGRLGYLYEPDEGEIGRKFGEEIAASVFEETVRESQLAKFASRMMHLDAAVFQVEKMKSRLRGERLWLKKREENRRQSLRLASVYARQKGGQGW